MLFRDVSLLNEDFALCRGMDVRTAGAYIVSVRETGTEAYAGAEKDADGGAERVIDGRGKLLVPAFYNLHTHAPMTLLRGYAENMKLQDWLEKRVFPFEDRLTGEDCYWAAALAIAESFAHGIVSSSDQYFFCEDIVRAAADTGAKFNVSRGLAFFGESLDVAQYRPYQEAKKLFYDFHDSLDGRIRVDIGLHGEYTATRDLIDAVAGLSSETGAPVHVHISETRAEHEGCKERNGGKTPARLLADSGVFDRGGLAAHCVWLEEEDIAIMREKGVTAVTCPVSNMKLASGIADIPSLLEKGVNVALGTDGAASNGSLNFFEEIKTMTLSAKLRACDPTLIAPRQALYAATRAGALAQGRPDCGFVKEGFRADMLVLDMLSPSLSPVYDMASALVFSASSRDILMTVADGRAVYERGDFPTLDIERTIAEVERSRIRILNELGEDCA